MANKTVKGVQRRQGHPGLDPVVAVDPSGPDGVQAGGESHTRHRLRDLVQPSSARGALGEQEAALAEPLSPAQLSAEHQASVQLAGESRRGLSATQSERGQELDARQNAPLVARELRQGAAQHGHQCGEVARVCRRSGREWRRLRPVAVAVAVAATTRPNLRSHQGARAAHDTLPATRRQAQEPPRSQRPLSHAHCRGTTTTTTTTTDKQMI